MKLLIFLLLLIPSIFGTYMTGTFSSQKHMPILTQSDLLKAVHKPGLFAWRFNIPSNASETSISLQGLEFVARLAERKRCDLSVRIEVDQNRNISIALNKCGLHSSTSSTVMRKEIIIVPPSYFTIISNVGLVGCQKIEQPMQLMIHGKFNTTGTISVNVLEYPSSAKMLLEDMVIYYFYPLLFAIMFSLVGCACASMFCCSRDQCSWKFVKHQKHCNSGIKGIKGTFV